MTYGRVTWVFQVFSPLFTPPDTHVPSWASRHRGRVTHRWLWGAPSCRCGRCRTAAPASGPYTRTSPGLRSAPDRSGGRPSHAERLYLETERWERKKKGKKTKTCETRSTTPPIVTKINSYNGGIKWFSSTFSSSAVQIVKLGLLVKIKRLIRYNIFSQRVPGISPYI